MTELIERLEGMAYADLNMPVERRTMLEAAERLRKLEAVREAAEDYTGRESHTAEQYADKYAARLRLREALADCGDEEIEPWDTCKVEDET